MPALELPLLVRCGSDRLLGIVHQPERPRARGVLIVVGGPQYRIGSHRQFVLLARALCAQGYPVMRFDHRGIGDSEGTERGFERIDDDIAAALDRFFERSKGLSDVVIWGLCDAASAALFYAHRSDPRVSGLVLLNPWVRTEATLARTHLRHYYLARLVDRAFWRRVFGGRFRAGTALRSLGRDLSRARARPRAGPAEPYPERMAAGLQAFAGPVLLVLSGEDLTATEFTDVAASSARWQQALDGARIERRSLPAANHTFARREWRDEVARSTAQWLASW